jgi:hypothetical protein
MPRASRGKKQLAQATLAFIHLNDEKHHKLRELISDKEAIYTALRHQILQPSGVKAIQSPPYNKHLNGRIERAIDVLQRIALGLMIQANWLTPSFWTGAFHQGMRILNHRYSRVPGSRITRAEDFLLGPLDCLRFIMLPFGDLVAYRIRKQVNADLPFPVQCRVGYYQAPSPDTPAAILVYSTTSKRVLTAHTWRLLRAQPAPHIMRWNHHKIIISQQYDSSLPQLFLRSHASHTLWVQRSLAPPVDVMKACVRGIFAYVLDNINTVQELVTLTTRTFMCNKKFLLEMAENPSILNFPVTSDQIRKYYVPLDACPICGCATRVLRA